MFLKGRVAIVTGGNSGIGKAIVLELAEQGANVAIDYVSHADATEELERRIVALGDRTIGVDADVSQVADLQRLIDATLKAFGRLDIMRLMGLVWTKAPRPRIEAAMRDVRTHQESDGGWSQFGRTAADAYATGLSLFALCVAGVPPTDDSYQKGVTFLLNTQYQDGTWLVKTHSFPVQRYFESGFPFGRHQWISTAATSWASLAIAQTLPSGRTCGAT